MNVSNIESAKRFIEENLAESLRLEDVSRQAGMSKYYFERTFKAHTGETFKGYLNRLRIETAKSLLRDQEKRVTDVCYAVGYNDLSYFNRVFRRHEGMSPSSYRKQFRGKQDSPSN